MTPADPLVALQFVVRVLEGLGVPHFVTGSVASSVLIQPPVRFER